MAMQGRQEVVRRNIELLALQTKAFQLVLIYSDESDGEFVYDMKYKYKFVHIVYASNDPLGKKWQAGVDYARTIGADPLIPLGSDDFFNLDFVRNACDLSEAIDFIGLTQWWVYDSTVKQLYKLRYINEFPLGGGRIISERVLNRIDWEVFDVTKNRLLDDLLWDHRDRTWQLLDETTPYGLQILSVKGRWEVMNPLDKILQSPNILHAKVNNIDDIMGFKVKEKLTL